MLGVETVSSPEGMVPALRFSTRPLPTKEKPAMPDAMLDKAIESIKSGKRTIDQVEKTYSLTAEQKKALTDV